MKKGVPFLVKIRAYLFHAIIAGIALIVDVLLFLFLMANVVGACAEIKRIDDSTHTEIVYAGARNGDINFYYLNQQHLVGEKITAVSCDILMIEEGAAYPETPIYFDGSLEKGTCAVSKNLADSYGLKEGATAYVAGTEIAFKVVRLLPAQSGLDKSYKREGVVVLGFDGQLLDKNYSFVSFMTDGDNYSELTDLVFIKNWRPGSVNAVVVGAVVFAVAFATTMAVCEIFLFAKRRADYRVYIGLGRTQAGAFFAILGENALKYVLPLALTALIFVSGLVCYEAMYLLPILFCFTVSAFAIVGYSFVLLRRLCRCRVKMKR